MCFPAERGVVARAARAPRVGTVQRVPDDPFGGFEGHHLAGGGGSAEAIRGGRGNRGEQVGVAELGEKAGGAVREVVGLQLSGFDICVGRCVGRVQTVLVAPARGLRAEASGEAGADVPHAPSRDVVVGVVGGRPTGRRRG